MKLKLSDFYIYFIIIALIIGIIVFSMYYFQIELDFQVVLDNLDSLLKGIQTTLFLCIIGNTLSLVFGTLVCLAKLSKNRYISTIASSYIELFRNTPLLVQIYFFFYGLNLPPFVAAIVGLCAYTSPYIAEVIRAGILTIPEYELKAADSLGISGFDKTIFNVLPQAFRIVIPPLGSQLMNLTKNTSIVYFLAINDITYIFDSLSSQTFKYFEFFIVTALTYMFLCWFIAIFSHLLERILYVPGLSKIDMEAEH